MREEQLKKADMYYMPTIIEGEVEYDDKKATVNVWCDNGYAPIVQVIYNVYCDNVLSFSKTISNKEGSFKLTCHRQEDQIVVIEVVIRDRYNILVNKTIPLDIYTKEVIK